MQLLVPNTRIFYQWRAWLSNASLNLVSNGLESLSEWVNAQMSFPKFYSLIRSFHTILCQLLPWVIAIGFLNVYGNPYANDQSLHSISSRWNFKQKQFLTIAFPNSYKLLDKFVWSTSVDYKSSMTSSIGCEVYVSARLMLTCNLSIKLAVWKSTFCTGNLWTQISVFGLIFFWI